MPRIYRRRTTKPSTRRRRVPRPAMRRRRVMAVPRPSTILMNWGRSKPYNTKVLFNFNVMSGAGAPISQLATFRAIDIPGVASWADNFDQFRINKIVAKFANLRTEMTDDAVVPRVFCRFNYDDSLLVTSIGNLAFWSNKRNVKVHLFTQTDNTLTYTFYPRVMAAGLLTGGGYAPMPRKAGWQDIEHNILHYGFMYYIPVLQTGQQMTLDFEFHLSFKEQQ